MSVWIAAMRPKTLPAAIVPVIVGTAVAVLVVGDDREAEPATWGVGACVEQGGEEPLAVSCGGPHDGRLIGVDDTGEACPGATDAFVADRGYVWCVDTDR